MKEMLNKAVFAFLIGSLFGGWFIWGPFCPFCIDADFAGNSREGSGETCELDEHSKSDHGCGSHHQDECRNCDGEFVQLHFHEKFVFTLSDKSRAGGNPLAAAVLTSKAVADFQFKETEPAEFSAASIHLFLESRLSVVMLA